MGIEVGPLVALGSVFFSFKERKTILEKIFDLTKKFSFFFEF